MSKATDKYFIKEIKILKDEIDRQRNVNGILETKLIHTEKITELRNEQLQKIVSKIMRRCIKSDYAENGVIKSYSMDVIHDWDDSFKDIDEIYSAFKPYREVESWEDLEQEAKG